MKTITTYEIVDYGIYGDQYFQGHGVSFTEYEYCALGAGDNYTEALEDALEQAAMMGYKIEFSYVRIHHSPLCVSRRVHASYSRITLCYHRSPT